MQVGQAKVALPLVDEQNIRFYLPNEVKIITKNRKYKRQATRRANCPPKLAALNIAVNLIYALTPVLNIMDAGYCLYVHIFMKNIKSLKPFNFNNSNQLMPDAQRKRQKHRNNQTTRCRYNTLLLLTCQRLQ